MASPQEQGRLSPGPPSLACTVGYLGAVGSDSAAPAPTPQTWCTQLSTQLGTT